MGGTLIASQRPAMLISHYLKTNGWTEQLDAMPSIYSYPIIPTVQPYIPLQLALDLKMNQSINHQNTTRFDCSILGANAPFKPNQMEKLL